MYRTSIRKLPRSGIDEKEYSQSLLVVTEIRSSGMETVAPGKGLFVEASVIRPFMGAIAATKFTPIKRRNMNIPDIFSFIKCVLSF